MGKPVSRWCVTVELEFRDGLRVVPEYLGRMMGGIETHRYTYEQVVQMVNQRMVGDIFGKRQNEMIQRHFKDHL